MILKNLDAFTIRSYTTNKILSIYLYNALHSAHKYSVDIHEITNERVKFK